MIRWDDITELVELSDRERCDTAILVENIRALLGHNTEGNTYE
jgi:hypothetical protein